MGFQELSDEDLLDLIVQGNHDAFSILVLRHTDKFYSLAYKILAHQTDAEDIVQEAFLKLWKSPQLWSRDKKTKFTTWFYKVVSNKCLDLKRKKFPAQIEDGFEIKSPKLLEDEIHKKQQFEFLNQVLSTLPEKQKLAIDLIFRENLPYKEAAEIMEVSVKALESMVYRAKDKLRDKVRNFKQNYLTTKGTDNG